jgi:lysyl-tRNA synthetase, class I
MPVSFQMLLTLVSSSNAENAETLWGFIGRYKPGVTPDTHPELGKLVEYALSISATSSSRTRSYREPTKPSARRSPTCATRFQTAARCRLRRTSRTCVYDVGRREPRYHNLAAKAKDGKPGVSLDWFNMLYQVLLGQEKGPRFGSFVAVYGIDNTRKLIARALNGELAGSDEPPAR